MGIFRHSRLTTLLLPAVGQLVAVTPALADFQLNDWTLHRANLGEWRLTGSVSTFSTSQNRDGGGTLVQIDGLESYRRTAASLMAEWGAHSRLTFYGRVNWLWNDLRSTTLNANRFGFSDQTLGLSLRLLEGVVALDAQVQADLPVYSNVNDQAQGLPFLGDGSTDITVGGFASAGLGSLGSLQLQGTVGAGYTLRSAQFSSAVPWSAEVSATPGAGRGFKFAVAAAGFQSLKTDPRGATAISASEPTTYSAGSFLVNAVNPSLATASGSIGYQFPEGSSLNLRYRTPIWGQAVAEGTLVSAGFEMPLGGSARKLETRRRQRGNRKQEVLEYASGATVKAVVSTRTLLIDQGSENGLAMGDLIDIFSLTPEGSPRELVARGQVVHLEWNQAQINLLETYQETAIKEGFLARKPINP